MSPKIRMGSSPFSANAFNGKLKNICYCAHTGQSMSPTLSYKDLLEIEPCHQVLVGDVILFRYKAKLIVHRVISIAEEGIKTRGDNNDIDDFELLIPQDIIGKVVAAWNSHRRRKIYGGLIGRFFAIYIRTRRTLYGKVISILTPIYYFAVSWGVLQSLISPLFSPKIVRFNYFDQKYIRLMIGPHVIGHYDHHLGRWNIYPPFLLFINKTILTQEEDYHLIADD